LGGGKICCPGVQNAQIRPCIGNYEVPRHCKYLLRYLDIGINSYVLVCYTETMNQDRHNILHYRYTN